MFLSFLFGPTLAFGDTYDDFNGDSIDTNLWDIRNTCGIFSQSAGYLNIDSPIEPQLCWGSSLQATNTLSGDFEIEIDFRNFQTSYVGGFSPPRIDISIKYDHVYSIRLDRSYVWGVHRFTSYKQIYNGSYGQTIAPANFDFGALKISRIGSIVQTYYKDGNNGWVHRLTPNLPHRYVYCA